MNADRIFYAYFIVVCQILISLLSLTDSWRAWYSVSCWISFFQLLYSINICFVMIMSSAVNTTDSVCLFLNIYLVARQWSNLTHCVPRSGNLMEMYDKSLIDRKCMFCFCLRPHIRQFSWLLAVIVIVMWWWSECLPIMMVTVVFIIITIMSNSSRLLTLFVCLFVVNSLHDDHINCCFRCYKPVVYVKHTVVRTINSGKKWFKVTNGLHVLKKNNQNGLEWSMVLWYLTISIERRV